MSEQKFTHIVRCITDQDPYLTKGNEYKCWLDSRYSSDGGVDACDIICDDGYPGYFMFDYEYEIVRELTEDEK